MSSDLTIEQKRRMEENKRIALERLSRKRPPPPTNNSLPQNKRPNWTYSSKKKNKFSSAAVKGRKNETGSLTFKRKIEATFTLCSETKFKAVVAYDKELINIFKQMSSRFYDPNTQIWSFELQDYHNLTKMVEDSLPHIKLNLIPKPVLNTFISQLPSERKESNGKDPPIDYKDRIGTDLYTTLMDFQKEGVEYCLKRNGRCLIADDMGLGKTLQAIAVVSYYRNEWPLLIVCPSSLKILWAEALKRWVPSLSDDDINVVMTTKDSLDGLVTIISYDLLTRMSKLIKSPPTVMIADESHFLKNYKTARSKATLPLLKKAKRSLLLSGTPALSRPIELYTQITALDKQFRVSMINYGQRYCNGFQNNFGWDFSGSSNMAELQMYMENKMMIRRLKRNVLDQLPSKRRQTIILDLSMTKGRTKEWKKLSHGLKEVSNLDKSLERTAALMPLFSKTGALKLPAVKDYLFDQLEGGRKLLVFAHHRIVMDGLCEFVTSKKFHYIRIDGNTPPELRQAHCDRFQHDEQCKVAILSITAANTGLTFTAASCVIFAELFWNPGVLVQAEDRVHRIGQHNSVNIHYLVAQNTVDDFIWPMVHKKLQVLTEAGLAVEDFSKSDSSHYKSSPDQLTLDDWILQEDLIQNDLTSDVATCSSSDVSQDDAVSTTGLGILDEDREENWFQSLDEKDLLLSDSEDIC